MLRTLFAVMFLGISSMAFAEKLVVYSGRGESLVGPLLEQFTEETGIALDIRYNNTPAITTQLLTEKQDSPADVVFLQDPGYLSVLSEAKLLAPLSNTVLEQVDKRFRGDDKNWIGTSARVRVLVYNMTKIQPEELPKTLAELPNEKWRGRIGWAPANGSAQAQMSAMYDEWGGDKLIEWLNQMQSIKPVVYNRNSAMVEAVNNGEIDLGWTNHYYAIRLGEKDPNFAAVNYRFPTNGDIGNVLMVAGAAILESSNKKEQAETFINYLVSEKAQNYFTQIGFEYPTRPGIETSPDLIPMNDMGLANVKQASLANVQRIVVLLQEMGIL